MENLQMEHDKCKDLLDDAKHIESWKEETETMNQHIVQLEQQLKCCKGLKDINDHDKILNKDIETQPKACENCSPNAKNRCILALERQVTALKNSSKNHTSTTKSSEKDNSDEKTNVKVEEKISWKQEIEAKNQHIIELKQELVLLENLLRENVDVHKIRDLEKRINRKSKRIVELENAVGELEDFLKEDVKEIRDLHCQISLDKERIVKMEKWIQKNTLTNAGIDKARIIELEEMVTNLEDYVKEHDIDGLKRKLQDRECRIVQLENQISELRKLSKFEENKPVRDMPKANFLSNNEVARELEENKQKTKDVMHAVFKEANKIQEYEQEESLKIKLQEKEQKMQEMGHDISEKDNKIQRYEQQIVEQQNKIVRMEKEMTEMEEGCYEMENISAKQIRLKNERVQELEMEVNSLKTTLGERIDVAIEELIAILKEKEEIELQLKKDLADKEHKLKELDTALRQSIAITDEIEMKLKNEKKLRKEVDQRIAEMEEKIAIIQATKCITCKPLFYKIFKTEEKLVQSNQKKTVQLQELHEIKRDALKAALSEKDAHLALLEHSGIQTPTQADQAVKLKIDKKILLDKLKEEDKKSIKLDFKREAAHLFQKIFKTSDDSEDSSDNNNNSFDDHFSRINSPKSVAVNDDSSPTSATTSSKYSTKTTMVSDMKDEDHPQIHHQDTR